MHRHVVMHVYCQCLASKLLSSCTQQPASHTHSLIIRPPSRGTWESRWGILYLNHDKPMVWLRKSEYDRICAAPCKRARSIAKSDSRSSSRTPHHRPSRPAPRRIMKDPSEPGPLFSQARNERQYAGALYLKWQQERQSQLSRCI